MEHGFRLRVPATALWFNLDGPEWGRIAEALVRMGADQAQGGLDGELLWSVAGLTVSYRAEDKRMQVEVTAEGGAAAAGGLAALRTVAPPPAAEASPIWLWSPGAFRIGEAGAAPADRVLRAGRWRLARRRSTDAVAAVEDALQLLDDRATLVLDVQQECAVSVNTPLVVSDRQDLERRARAFDALLGRLGEPVRAEHVTYA